MKLLHQVVILFTIVVNTIQVDKAPLLAQDSNTAIPGEYNVVLKNNLLDKEVEEHMKLIHSMIKSHGTILHEYDIGRREEMRFRGYGAKLDDKQVDMIRSMSQVKYVERNQEYHTLQDNDCISELVQPWGIVRTNVRDWPPDVEYIYRYDDDAAGQGVDVYIIDTGIDLTHPEFEGRAKFGVDTTGDDPPQEDDPNGHGTHIAGVVISKSYGIARKATAVAVRVLNAAGSGSIAGVIDGIVWSVNDHKQGSGQGKKSVANMSLGGGFSQVMNDAVNAAIDDGLSFTIAAGGSASNACNFSPASSNGITAASTDKNDRMASSSSYGECVNIFGPGVGILSTIPGGGVAEFSGTSMSAAHIAGVAAKYLSTQPPGLSQDELLKWFRETGTKDKIEGIPSTDPPTPNLLPFMDCKQMNITIKGIKQMKEIK